MKVETKKTIIIEMSIREAFVVKEILQQAIKDGDHSGSYEEQAKKLVDELEANDI